MKLLITFFKLYSFTITFQREYRRFMAGLFPAINAKTMLKKQISVEQGSALNLCQGRNDEA
jgi:hypothetical protein